MLQVENEMHHYFRGEIEEKRDATPGLELLRKEKERGFVPPKSRGEEGGVIEDDDEEERKLIKLPDVRILDGRRRVLDVRFICIEVDGEISLIKRGSGIGIKRIREKCSNQVVQSVGFWD